MSKSYKKAIIKYAGDMSRKKEYNRSLRRSNQEIPNGNAYKKMNCQYDLWDCKANGIDRPDWGMRPKQFKKYGKNQVWRIKK